MSALTMLLGPSPQESFAHARTLQMPDGEQVHFQEDDAGELVIVFSLPGVMTDTAWLVGQQQPWRSVLNHGKYDNVERALTIAPDSGQVYLIDICARTALHPGMFEEFLADHVARHRDFRRLLEPDDDDAEAASTELALNLIAQTSTLLPAGNRSARHVTEDLSKASIFPL